MSHRESGGWSLKHDPALKPPKPLKYRMRGYGGGPEHTSLHPRHWDTTKTVMYVPGIGYCRTREAIPYLRRLLDARIRQGEGHLAEHAELEKKISASRGSNRAEMLGEVAELRTGLEKGLEELRELKASLERRPQRR